MLTLSVNQEMMLRIIAHHILHKTEFYDAECNGVQVGALHTSYPDHKSRRSIREPLIGDIHSDGAFVDREITKGVLNALAEDVWDEETLSRTNMVELLTLTVSKRGAEYLVERGFVPMEQIGALACGIETFDPSGDFGANREEGEGFPEWLAAGWEDPTGFVHQPGAKEAKGAVGVNSASKWVRKLSYTPAEAAAEHARIESGALTMLSKRAYKAHVTRRMVEAAQ